MSIILFQHLNARYHFMSNIVGIFAQNVMNRGKLLEWACFNCSVQNVVDLRDFRERKRKKHKFAALLYLDKSILMEAM